MAGTVKRMFSSLLGFFCFSLFPWSVSTPALSAGGDETNVEGTMAEGRAIQAAERLTCKCLGFDLSCKQPGVRIKPGAAAIPGSRPRQSLPDNNAQRVEYISFGI